MTASPHDPSGNGADESNGSDGDECVQHSNNIRVLMLWRAGRLKVLHDVPGHHTEDRNQHKGDHGGLSS